MVVLLFFVAETRLIVRSEFVLLRIIISFMPSGPQRAKIQCVINIYTVPWWITASWILFCAFGDNTVASIIGTGNRT